MQCLPSIPHMEPSIGWTCRGLFIGGIVLLCLRGTCLPSICFPFSVGDVTTKGIRVEVACGGVHVARYPPSGEYFVPGISGGPQEEE